MLTLVLLLVLLVVAVVRTEGSRLDVVLAGVRTLLAGVGAERKDFDGDSIFLFFLPCELFVRAWNWLEKC